MKAICVYFGADHQAALDATGCHAVMCGADKPLQKGIDYVIQVTGCLIHPNKPLPDLARTIRGLEALAERGVRRTVIGHEIGLTHPGAVSYLTAVRKECGRLGMSAACWCANSHAANPTMTGPANVDVAREAGCAVWREMQVMRPTDYYVTEIATCVRDLRGLGTHPEDALVIYPVGLKLWRPDQKSTYPTMTLQRLEDVLTCVSELWNGNRIFHKWSVSRWDTVDGLREWPEHAALIRRH